MSARTILKHLHQQGRMTDYQFDVINRNLRERPQGHWVAIKNKNGTILAYSCSECEYNPYHAKISDYCPNCGADMRKGTENE